MENKKNNFLVIFLLLIIIGLIGFIVYDKGMLVKQTTVEEQEKDTERQFNTEVAEEILDKFNINSDTVEKYSSNEVVKFRAVINNLKENYNMYYSCKELLSAELNEWENYNGTEGYSRSIGNDTVYYCGNDTNYRLYLFDEVNKKYKEMFNSSLEKKSYGQNYYIKDKDGFAYIPYADGTFPATVKINKVTSANITDDELTIVSHIDSFSADDGKNFKVGDNLIEFDPTDRQYDEKVIKEITEKYLDNVKKYEISFKIKNDRYVFQSIKKSK